MLYGLEHKVSYDVNGLKLFLFSSVDLVYCPWVQTRFLVPKQLTFPSVLTKQSGVVPGMIDRWHHLLIPSLEDLVILKLNPGEISVKLN